MRAYALALCSAVALCACDAGTSPGAIGPSGLAHLTTSAAAWAYPPHPDHGKSWFAPDIGEHTQLLFVSDSGTDDVYMYKLPSLKVVGTITGFDQPQGECSDTKGDIWITDTNDQTIYEVSHQGRLQNKLTDTNGYPDGCAWDSKTGDLAVTNLFSANGASGNVLVYPSGSKLPALYQNPRQYYYNFGGYDTSGDLFFDGRNAGGGFMLSELAKGAKEAKTVALTGGTIYFPGMVQWSSASSQLIVGDQDCGNTNAACVYQVSLSGGRGTISGTTKLQNSGGGQVCDLVQGVEFNGQITGSDNNFCGSSPSTTYLWPYPGGGSPSRYNSTVDTTPVGAAISGGVTAAGIRAKSWVRPGLANRDLIYVADSSDGEVTVYGYQSKQLYGVLADFVKPMGECADSKGDVFIADYAKQAILEYAHGGKKPVNDLNDSPYSPYGCAVDPTTGNLAVANVGSRSGGGNIAIYVNASGKPTLYTNKILTNFQACVYDNDGTLLVTSGDAVYSQKPGFAWLPKSGNKLINVKIPGPESGFSWDFVNGIQWDGKFFVIDDYENLYQVSLMNGQAYYVGTTHVDGDVSGPFWIYNPRQKGQGAQAIAGYNDESYGSGVDYFSYPAGGDPIGNFTHGIDSPYGVTISLRHS